MAKVVPAILPKNYFEIEEALAKLRGATRRVQIDICDGTFVPSRTWPYSAGKPEQDQYFQDMLSEDAGMPFWKDFDFEFHLMVKHADTIVPDMVVAGASGVVLPIESKGVEASDLETLKEAIKELKKSYGEWLNVIISLNLETNNQSIAPFAEFVDGIQLMAIAKPGYQGQAFDQRVFEKLDYMKKNFPNLPVSIDGGVNLENSHDLVAHGADVLIIGSALLRAENPVDFIKSIEAI